MPSSQPETRYSLLDRLRHSEDYAAWKEFVSIYRLVIRKAAKKRGLQDADADNLVQEVFLAVSRSIEKWLEKESRGKFRAWLLQIARNEAIDLLTRRSTRSLGEDGQEAMDKMQVLCQADEISHLIDHQYRLSLFQTAAREVKKTVASHTWQAFYLTHIEGFSAEQAARDLGTRPGNIHFARSRVMAKIKSFVKRYEESYE